MSRCAFTECLRRKHIPDLRLDWRGYHLSNPRGRSAVGYLYRGLFMTTPKLDNWNLPPLAERS